MLYCYESSHQPAKKPERAINGKRTRTPRLPRVTNPEIKDVDNQIWSSRCSMLFIYFSVEVSNELFTIPFIRLSIEDIYHPRLDVSIVNRSTTFP